MLAQNFKTAAELEITEPQRQALVKVLVLLETDKLQYVPSPPQLTDDLNKAFTGHFNMRNWITECPCGTVACIGGTAELIGNVTFRGQPRTYHLLDLFSPQEVKHWDRITPVQAALALRSYLTVGSPRWDLAITNAG